MEWTWYRSWGGQETLLMVVFGVLYLLFVLRLDRSARVLGVKPYRVWIKAALRLSYFLLLLLAFLGPSFGKIKREIAAVGKDIYIALDLSGSMNAQDIAPSRLDRVKFELKKLSDAFASDRLGLIIFSSEAFVQCPLTYDQRAFSLFLETLNTNLVPKSGTDFGPPLRMALEKHTEDQNSGGRPSAKIILLISDGEDFGKEAQEVAQEIKQAGIRLFTLGIGTATGGKIPANNGFKRDAQGNEVITRLNSDDLQELSRITDGKYFEVSDTRNDISRLIQTIVQIEGQTRDVRQLDASANKYYYLLYLALGLILIDLLLMVRLLKL
ncbi:MAG: VWA domain-containing protein [Bernardetiaceae bacterium]